MSSVTSLSNASVVLSYLSPTRLVRINMIALILVSIKLLTFSTSPKPDESLYGIIAHVPTAHIGADVVVPIDQLEILFPSGVPLSDILPTPEHPRTHDIPRYGTSGSPFYSLHERLEMISDVPRKWLCKERCVSHHATSLHRDAHEVSLCTKYDSNLISTSPQR